MRPQTLLAFGLGSLSPLISAASTGNRRTFTVDTGYAIYQGNNSLPNTVAYLGVPYAQPPVGDLRYRAPASLDTAELAKDKKVVNATNYPNFCIQGTQGLGDAGGAGSEDCLKLNIYAPASASPKSKLPVSVYIHGGAYYYGNPRNWPFDHWVEQSPNFVAVSLYYRLDSFGFLAHPDFESDPALADPNAGFLDQIKALEWVQQYIEAFGGDPSQVTIMGQSAGASSVELHLVANEPKSLYKAAIAQSVYRTPVPSLKQQEPLFDEFSMLAGCPSGTTAQKMACLRKASISDLAKAQDATFNSTKIPYKQFHPVVDGKVILDYPTRLIQEGKFKKVSVLVGATSNETLAMGSSIPSALTSYFPGLTQTDIKSIMSITPLYPQTDFVDEAILQADITGDHSARCGREIINTAASHSGKKAFGYRYNTVAPPAQAVEHSAENYIMFRGTQTGFNGTTTFHPQNTTEVAFAEELIAYWVSFVRTGDPNTFKLARSPSWPEWKSGTRVVLQENGSSPNKSSSYIEDETPDDLERCQKSVDLVEHEQN